MRCVMQGKTYCYHAPYLIRYYRFTRWSCKHTSNVEKAVSNVMLHGTPIEEGRVASLKSREELAQFVAATSHTLEFFLVTKFDQRTEPVISIVPPSRSANPLKIKATIGGEDVMQCKDQETFLQFISKRNNPKVLSMKLLTITRYLFA